MVIPTGPISAPTTSPRCRVTRTFGPTMPFAAVAPRATTSSRPHAGDLGLQPRAAGPHLVRGRRLVDPALAARLPLEVLHHVGDVDPAPVDAGLGEGPVEQLARTGPTNGRPRGPPGRRAARRPASSLASPPPLAEDRLGGVAPQVAGPAAGRRGAQRGQRRAGRGSGNALRKRHAEAGCRRDATGARKV